MINEDRTHGDTLQQVAKLLFNSQVEKIREKSISEEIYLNSEQIKRLAQKICLLPEEWQEALVLCYGCGFDIPLISDLLEDSDVNKNILYAKDTLAFGMNVPSISTESMTEACHIVLKNIRIQIKQEQQNTRLPISKKLDKRIWQLIHKQGKVEHVRLYSVAKRVAMVFLALLVASTVTVLSVEALRTKFFDWLFSVFPTHTRVEFSGVALPSSVDYPSHMNQYAPTYLPEGFVLVNTVETGTRYKLYYENATAQRIIFEVQAIKDQAHMNINTEDFELIEIPLSDFVGYYVYDGSSHMLFWSNDLCFFNIICDTTKNDAIKIAESTKIK